MVYCISNAVGETTQASVELNAGEAWFDERVTSFCQSEVAAAAGHQYCDGSPEYIHGSSRNHLVMIYLTPSRTFIP